jgi:ureidoglycolate lyase
MSQVLRIRAEPLSARAYRPFGQVIGVDRVQMRIVNDRFYMNALTMKYRPLHITHLHRHIKSTQALIPLGGKPCLVVVAPPSTDLCSAEELSQVKAFINDGSFGVNLALGTWHMAPLPLGADVCVVTIQGEHASADLEECWFESRFSTIMEVVL